MDGEENSILELIAPGSEISEGVDLYITTVRKTCNDDDELASNATGVPEVMKNVGGSGFGKGKIMKNVTEDCESMLKASFIQDFNEIVLLLPSRKGFTDKYKAIFFEEDKVKSFFLRVLIEIEKTIRLGNIDDIQNINKIIGYLNEIENNTWLKECYDLQSNPIKETNLIILACQFNKVNILKYLCHDNNNMLQNLSIAIKRNTFKPGDKDRLGRTAFYYAILECNVDLLDVLVNKSLQYFKNSSQPLDDLLSNAYAELKLRNVYLSKEIQFFVEDKLINLRFFHNISNDQNFNIQTDLCNVLERIDLVLKSIKQLQADYTGVKEVDEKFILIATFVTQNIHVLKRQLKGTYDRIPWEEIEFCLVSFISAHKNHQEINLIYMSVLTKDKMLDYLQLFVKKLKELKEEINETDLNSGLPKLSRECIINNIIAKDKKLYTLYSDFEQIKNVYSMKKIIYYLEFAILSNPQEIKGQLIIERALLVTGEYLKNSLESPNLSDDVSEILLSSGLQNDTIVLLRSLRNILSHSHSLNNRMQIKKTKAFNVFSTIQSDLKKIKAEIADILCTNKLIAIRELIKKIIDQQSLEEIVKLIETFKHFELDKICLEYTKTREHEVIENLVMELKEKISYKTYQQAKVFQEIDTILESGKNRLKSTNHKFCSSIVRLQIMNHANIFNDIVNVKWTFQQILNLITTKAEKEDLKRITFLSCQLCIDIKKNLKKEQIQKFINKSFKDFKHISHLSISAVGDPKLKETSDYEKINYLICKIAYSAQFKLNKMKGVESLKNSYHKNKKKNSYFNDKNELNDCLIKRLHTLNEILPSNESLSQKLLGQFSIYEKDKTLQITTEMLILDIVEILQNRLANNQLIFDTNCPILLGKSLRNHLAHCNAVVDILSFDPLLAIFSNAITFIGEKNNLITAKNILLGQPVSDNLQKLKNCFDHNLNIIIDQMEMIDALKQGNFEKLKVFINKGTEIKSRDVNQRSSLHFAASGGNLEIVKFLLENGLDINTKDIDGQSSLYMAVKNGRYNIVKFFIEELSLPVDDIDNYGKTLLHIAAKNGHRDIVDYLLYMNAKTSTKDILGFAPVHIAIINNYKDVVKSLLSKEPNVDFNEVHGGFTPLHLAAEHGNLEIVNYLIENKAIVNVQNDNNWIPLHAAALNGNPNVVKTLIENDSNVNCKAVNGCTPLHYAVENGCKNVVEIILDHGGLVNAVDKTYNSAPLHHASKVGFQCIVELLIKNNADINMKTIAGMTPLHFAAQNGHLEIVNMLIFKKAKVNAKSNAGATPLDLAIQSGHVKIVESLLTRGANINLKGRNNLTPLHMAAMNGSKEIVDMLIKKEAHLDAFCIDGNTPLLKAITNGHAAIVKTLIESGANFETTDNNNLKPIHTAALYGYSDVLEILINKKNDVNTKAYVGKESLTPLHCAAINGNKETVKMLFENGANVDEISCGNTPLHFAIENSNIEVVKYLMQIKPNVDDNNNDYIRYLESAVWKGNKEIVGILIENGCKPTIADLHIAILTDCKDIVNLFLKNKIDVNEKYKNITPLTLAAMCSNREILKMLLDKGAEVTNTCGLSPLYFATNNEDDVILDILLKKGANIDVKSDEGLTPLHLASSEGFTNIVDILLENGANVNIKDNKNRTPLELAVAHKHFSVIEILLPKIIGDINAKGNDDWSLLHIAAQGGSENVVQYLIDKGADIHAKNSLGSKPIHIAAREGHCNIVDLFLCKGLSVYDLGAAKQTILHYASLNGQLEMVKYLTGKSIDVNAQDSYGMTALHIATKYGFKDVVSALLNNGAIYNAVDKFSCTPRLLAHNANVIYMLESTKKLFHAVKADKYLDVEVCIKAGACVNAKNTGNVTAIHYAAWKGYDNTIKSLLQNKGNPNATGNNGYRPLHYAAKFSNFKVVKTLLSNGAIYNVKDDTGKTPLYFAINPDIVDLFNLIDESFKRVKCNDNRVIDDLEKKKDVDIIKAVMNTKNREQKTIIVAAIQNNFDKIEELKQLLQKNVSTDIKMAHHFIIQEKFQEALDIYEKIFQKRKEIFGLDCPGTLDIQCNIATVLYKQRKYKETLEILKKIYEKQKNILGLDHKNTLSTRSHIGLVLHRLGKDEEALIIYDNILHKQETILGVYNKNTLETQLHMGLVLNKLERFDEALKINQSVYKKSLKISGITALAACNNIAMVLSNQKKYEEALKTYEEVYKRKKFILGPLHSDTLRTLHNIGTVLSAQNKHDEALKAFKEILNIQNTVLGPNHLDTLNTQNNIAEILFLQGKINGAYVAFMECFEQRKAILGSSHPDILETIEKIKIINDINKLKGHKISIILENKTNIFAAVNDSNIGNVKDLLESGVYINIKDDNGRTPLHHAVNNGDSLIVIFLLENGADMTQTTNKGNTPLHTAVIKSYKEILESLLHHAKELNPVKLGCFVNAKTYVGGTTALHVCVQNNKIELVEILLQYGACYNIKNAQFKTPLDLAKSNSDTKLLLSYIDKLFETVCVGKKDKIEDLLDEKHLQSRYLWKSILQAQDSNGKTLIQITKQRDVEKMLLEKLKFA